MITAKQAAALALQVVSQPLPPEQITDIVVSPLQATYEVQLSRLAGPDQAQTEIITVQIDRQLGTTLGTSAASGDNPVARLAPTIAGQRIISGPPLLRRP